MKPGIAELVQKLEEDVKELQEEEKKRTYPWLEQCNISMWEFRDKNPAEMKSLEDELDISDWDHVAGDLGLSNRQIEEYGRGSGKECRVHVQKLNSLRRNLEEKREDVLKAQLEDECEGQVSFHMSKDGNDGGNTGDVAVSVAGARVSKWSKYLSSDSDSEEEDLAEFTKATAAAPTKVTASSSSW